MPQETADPRLAELRELEQLAMWLDTRFRLPGTQIRFGLDGLLGLVPGIGDALVAFPAIYILVRAHRIGAPRHLLIRMATNLGIDWLVGSIPVLGDVFDVGFKANWRNVDLLRRHLHTTPAVSSPAAQRPALDERQRP